MICRTWFFHRTPEPFNGQIRISHLEHIIRSSFSKSSSQPEQKMKRKHPSFSLTLFWKEGKMPLDFAISFCSSRSAGLEICNYLFSFSSPKQVAIGTMLWFSFVTWFSPQNLVTLSQNGFSKILQSIAQLFYVWDANVCWVGLFQQPFSILPALSIMWPVVCVEALL